GATRAPAVAPRSPPAPCRGRRRSRGGSAVPSARGGRRGSWRVVRLRLPEKSTSGLLMDIPELTGLGRFAKLNQLVNKVPIDGRPGGDDAAQPEDGHMKKIQGTSLGLMVAAACAL